MTDLPPKMAEAIQWACDDWLENAYPSGSIVEYLVHVLTPAFEQHAASVRQAALEEAAVLIETSKASTKGLFITTDELHNVFENYIRGAAEMIRALKLEGTQRP